MFATTIATSAKSPSHSSTLIGNGKSALRQKSGSGGLTENMSDAQLDAHHVP
jgi:hypothetical protein